jgi:CheY-like chemotaxis protein
MLGATNKFYSMPLECIRPFASGSMASSMCILVTDDDPQMRQIYRLMLERKGGFTNVVEAADGETALKICQSHRVALIISDISKPGLDGIEMLRALRVDPHTSTIPVIFATTRTSPEFRQAAFDLGASDYLCMPFKSDELLQSVKRALLAQ